MRSLRTRRSAPRNSRTWCAAPCDLRRDSEMRAHWPLTLTPAPLLLLRNSSWSGGAKKQLPAPPVE